MSGMDRSLSSFNLKITIADGNSAAGDIIVADFAEEDELIFVGHFSTKGTISTLVDDTANCEYKAAGFIKSGTDTSSDLLQIFWIDKSL